MPQSVKRIMASMTKSHLPCVLSEEADKDLEDIFDYTAEQFGVDQAIVYVSGFEAVFDSLSNNPRLGRERYEIRPELRSITKESHVVFYRIMKNNIRIVRVLHMSRDVNNFIPPVDR